MQGIYIIENLVNGKIYVGSSIHIEKRWNEHINELRNKIHSNQILQRAWDKYGETSFSFHIVQEVSVNDDLINIEQWYLDNWKPEYNIAKFAGTSPVKGVGHKQSSIQKIKKHWTLQKRKKMSNKMTKEGNHRYGTSWSDETRKRVQNLWTDEYRKEFSEKIKGENHPWWGRKMSEAHKQKLSSIRAGENGSNSILTWKKVRKIRELYSSGDYYQKTLAEMYGVHIMTINDILHFRTWKE